MQQGCQETGCGPEAQLAAQQAWLSYTARLQKQMHMTQNHPSLLELPHADELSVLVTSGYTLRLATHVEELLLADLRLNHLSKFIRQIQEQFSDCSGRVGTSSVYDGFDVNEAVTCCEQLCSSLQELWMVLQQQLAQLQQLVSLLSHEERLHHHAAQAHIPTGRPPLQPHHHQGSVPLPHKEATPTSFTFPTILSTVVHAPTATPTPGMQTLPFTNRLQQTTECNSLALTGLLNSYRAHMTAMLVMSKGPCGLAGVLRYVFNKLLKVIPPSDDATDDDMDDDDDDDEDDIQDALPSSQSTVLLIALRRLSSLLCRLGASQLCHQTATECLNTCVRNQCTAMTQELDRRVLPDVWKFLDAVPLRFMKAVLEGEEESRGGEPCMDASVLSRDQQRVAASQHQQGKAGPTHEQRLTATLQVWRQRLLYMCYEAVGEMRCDQMFSIVIDYPESMMAVEDMAECLANTNLRSHFLTAFRSALSRRLLHPGASATDIVHTYVSAIRVVTALDVDGTLLPAVALPVRRYLRLRPDTVRCVVERVTGAPGLAGKAVVGAVGVVDESDQEAGTGLSLLEEVQQESQDLTSTGPVDDEDHVISLMASQKSHICVVTAGGQAKTAAAASLPHTFAGAGDDECPWSHAPIWAEGNPFMSGASSTVSKRHVGGGGSGGGGGPDVVDLMVQVFKNKEHFVAEYRSCLSVQLLRSMEHDTTQALRTIELLKLRFGEQTLHACEVMLKDMADSKRINTACHHMIIIPIPPPPPPSLAPQALGTPGVLLVPQSQGTPGAPIFSPSSSLLPPPLPSWLSATVISHLFWPQLGGWGDEQQKGVSKAQRSGPDLDAESSLVLPEQVATGLKAYEQRFHQLKTPRRLHWKPHLGLVELEITVGGVSLNARVSPVLASLLVPFTESASLTARQLSAMVGLPPLLVRRRLMFWLEAGIIVEQTHPGGEVDGGTPRYVRATSLEPWLHGVTLTDATAMDEASLNNGGASNSGVEEMAVFEPYIMGILLNTGGLSLDKLHTTLKRFVVSPKYEASQELLAAFLSNLVAADKLTVTAGVYKRKMAPARPAEN